MVLLPALLMWPDSKAAPELVQEEIDAAVRYTLETQSLPSRPARAAEMVRQSVVRVRSYVPREKEVAALPGKPAARNPTAKSSEPQRPEAELPEDLGKDNAGPDERLYGTGSGVVILENGTILTNFHVVAGAARLSVTFYDGMESDAEIVGLHPHNDLAVIRPKKIPDDLPPATMGASSRLKPGDEVVAVGFPFGIGPSVSAGVVSGLGRSLRSPKGENMLSGLIQFDAAVNSGNSGGPLITLDGELVGIVTAILNPTRAGTFIGIGFAVTMEGAGMAVGIPPF
jgi:S1-C subfamily serine protease